VCARERDRGGSQRQCAFAREIEGEKDGEKERERKRERKK